MNWMEEIRKPMALADVRIRNLCWLCTLVSFCGHKRDFPFEFLINKIIFLK